jgi:hypothetical protein
MKGQLAILAVISVFLVTACAPVQPQPDPMAEELAVLQKQLLELQKLQNDTRAKLDESTAAISVLSAKVKTMEERSTVEKPEGQARPGTANAGAPPVKKKPAKKTKKKKSAVRRQE